MQQSCVARQNNKGFTLVELSIVLVIIGLLIGGILAAQSMVASAKLNGFVKQIQQYDIAAGNFQTKYNYLPGDSPLHNANGNGDGFILDAANLNANYLGEILSFWKHLSDTELPNTNYDGTSYSRIEPGRNCPIIKYAKGATIIGLTRCSNCDTQGPYVFPAGTNLWLIRRELLTGSMLFEGNAEPANSTPLTTLQAYSVDAKMDDGIANNGNIRATNGERGGADPTIRNSGCVATDVSQYDIGNSSEVTNCALAIKMMSQTGQSN